MPEVSDFPQVKSRSFLLPFPPSVNGMYANLAKRGRIKSLPYRAWTEEAGWMLNQQRPGRFDGPVHIAYTFGKKNGRFDLSNFIKPIDDLLVHHKIISDDNSKVIVAFSVGQDPEIEGVLVHVSALPAEGNAA